MTDPRCPCCGELVLSWRIWRIRRLDGGNAAVVGFQHCGTDQQVKVEVLFPALGPDPR